MAKQPKPGSERGGFPERFEVLTYHFLRRLLKWLVPKAAELVEKTSPEVFLAAAWVYTKAEAENLKKWTEGTFLAGGEIVENIADILPLPEWIRKVIESVASDLPLNVEEYFKLRNAQRPIVFPDGYTGPKVEDFQKSIKDFALAFRDAFRDRIKRMAPWLTRWMNSLNNLRERLLGAKGEFRPHSFKAMRATFLFLHPDLREALVSYFWGPEHPKVGGLQPFQLRTADADQGERPMDHEKEQQFWNFEESAEYLDTPEKQAAAAIMARLYPRHFKFFLAMQDHDDWFNLLSPNLKAKVEAIGEHLSTGLGNMADDLNAWCNRQEDKMVADAKRDRKRMQNVAIGLVLLIGFVTLWTAVSRLIPVPLISGLVALMIMAAGCGLLYWLIQQVRRLRHSQEASRG